MIEKFLEANMSGHEMMVAVQEVLKLLKEADTGSGEFCITDESGEFGICYTERGIELVMFDDETGDMNHVISLKIV